MKKTALLLILALSLFGENLHVSNGSVAAHTQMMMDSTIDPVNSSLKGDIVIDGKDITTMQGKFWVDMNLFVSDEKDRDKNMYKEIETDKFKLATYTISNVKKAEAEGSYTIEGTLNFHGKEKPLNAKAKIAQKEGAFFLEANSAILVSDFGIKMPCMVFMCVRDQVDLVVKAELK
ncbi:MAG: hypothetical protein QG559_601 [Campylobacterota bacterium]|nr:hypothetical protein [Campylobacterota bacterium]